MTSRRAEVGKAAGVTAGVTAGTAAGRKTPRAAGAVGPTLVLGALAAWFGVTVAGQHPQAVFDRVRGFDPTGLLVPNWRFFAPEPAQHDYHLLHRVLTADGDRTEWRQTSSITPRAWSHMVWFPGRRREKAMFDLVSELIAVAARPGVDVRVFPAYRILVSMVAKQVRADYAGDALPRGFQFLIARHTGHEHEPEPEYPFISAFVPLAVPFAVPLAESDSAPLAASDSASVSRGRAR